MTVTRKVGRSLIRLPRGVLTDIGTFGGNGDAFRLNDAGQVVGNANLPDGQYHGFVW
jgi:hypothetical protein